MNATLGYKVRVVVNPVTGKPVQYYHSTPNDVNNANYLALLKNETQRSSRKNQVSNG